MPRMLHESQLPGPTPVSDRASPLIPVLSRPKRGLPACVVLGLLGALSACGRDVAPLDARFTAVMPGSPTKHTAVTGVVTATSYDVQRWGCVFNAIYSDSLTGGLAPSEAPTAIAGTVGTWGGKVTSERALAGWPDTAAAFEARGPGTFLVRGRIAVVSARTYIWYVGCAENRWRLPWVKHYAERFIEEMRPNQ